ncbi:MAG TPA: histone deacetylase [Ignisphaera aggregans]|uniref:Histone deacetylase n=1 Tax=Ignisphaera aggregans TaxID=334771 RepID=A0A833DUT7_9CREN|nr:histone deacetylase [Ignisphaera aggregans]
MQLFIAYSDDHKKHRPPIASTHPENPLRLEIAIEALRNSGMWDKADVIVPERADLDNVLAVHDSDYVELVREMSKRGGGYIDLDTYVSPHTFDVALLACGAAIQGVRLLLEKGSALFLSLLRPPGHHAGRYGRALGAPTLGFCIFNNIAIAAKYAEEVMKLRPIVIIDIDVHHGNGTQEIFWNDANVIHVDIHEHGIYPGTGDVEDIGGNEARGTKVNIPLPHYSGDDDYIYVWKEVVEPLVFTIKPRMIMLSLGLDAYLDDGLASMSVTSKFFTFAASSLALMAKRFLGTLTVLEGGYTVGLREGLPAFVRGYIQPQIDTEYRVEPHRGVRIVVNRVKKVLREFLGVL